MSDPLVGRTVGTHYVLEERLGEGAGGVVYRARHTLLEQDFAVKILSSPDAEARGRLLREARSLMRFTHKRAVQLRDCGESGDVLYLAMDLCPGETLEALLAREGRLDERRAASIALQVLDVLQEAHAAGIVHRDLKPSNLMVVRSGDEDAAHVLDFGLARLLGTEQARLPGSLATVAGTVVGTVAYMAPEQLRAEPDVDGRADLYALGVVLYEMVCGARPFGDGSALSVMARVLEGKKPPPPVASGASATMAAVLERAMLPDRSARFRDAAEFAGALRDALAGKAPPAPRRKVPARLLLGALGLVALAIGVSLLLPRLGGDGTAGLRAEAARLYLDGRFEAAAERYSRIIAAGGANGEDYLGRARAGVELRRQAARADLDQAATRLGRDPRVPLEYARFAWLVEGRLEAADRTFRETLAAASDFPEARLERAQMLLDPRAEGLFEGGAEAAVAAAASTLEAVDRLAGGDGRVAAARAMLDVQTAAEHTQDERERLLAAAEARVRAAADADPKLAAPRRAVSLVRTARGYLAREQGQEREMRQRYGEAVEAMSGAIARTLADPGYREQGRLLPALYRERAAMRIELQDQDGAAADLGELLERNPNHQATLETCGEGLTHIGRFEEAIPIYERLADIDPRNPEYVFRVGFSHQQIGQAHVRMGDPDRARPRFEEALVWFGRGLRIQPGYPNCLNYRAETNVQLARLAEGADRERFLAAARADFDTVPEAQQDTYRESQYFLEVGDARRALGVLMRRTRPDKGGSTSAEYVWLAHCLLAVAGIETDPERARAAIADAMRACERAAALQPEWTAPVAYRLRGDCRVKLAEMAPDAASRAVLLRDAIDDFRRAVEVGASRPDAIAEARFREAETRILLGGDPAAAAAAARAAVAQREEEAAQGRWNRLAEDYERLGTVLEGAGFAEEAAEAHARARAAAR